MESDETKVLKEMILDALDTCTDPSLLDLVYKLLIGSIQEHD